MRLDKIQIMTTITIKESIELEKNEFENFDELVSHLLEKAGFGVLIPLDKKEITPDREKRFQNAINTPKSKMFNI